MNLIDRFTKDEVSANVWWPLAVLLLVLTILTIPGQNRAEDEARADASGRARAVTEQSLAPAAATLPLDHVTDTVASVVTDDILSEDPVVDVVRIWSTSGELLYSSNVDDQIGSSEALNDEQVQAVATQGRQLTETSDQDLDGQQAPAVYRTYTPIRDNAKTVTSISEITSVEETLLSDVQTEWLGYRLVLGVVALLVLGLALLSLRRAATRIGAGVPFVPESVPEGQTLIEVDRVTALEEAGGVARRRVAAMEDRVRAAEEARWKLEGQLQQALSGRATARRAPAAMEQVETPEKKKTRITKPAASSEPAAAQPDLVAASVDGAVNSADLTASEPEAIVVPEPELTEVPEAEPTAVRDPSPEPEPVVAEPEPAADEPEPAVAQIPDSPQIVRVSEPVAADAVASASSDETPLDVLSRLVEKTRTETSVDDPSVMRARLARTAALKKPGSRERREEHDRSEHEPS